MSEISYNIYSPVVHSSHRDFYEEIMGKLRGTSVICALGRCKAIEVSKSQADHDVISSLMNDVEKLSDELMSIAKRLFERFYQDKEDFYRRSMISMAACKIDLMDRNLLERTCDVRWWSLEMAFCDCLGAFQKSHEHIESLNNQLDHFIEQHDEIANEHPLKKLKNLIEIEDNDSLQGMYLPRCQREVSDLFDDAANANETRKVLGQLIFETKESLLGLHRKIEFACIRLEDIVNAYTLYRDLVITCKEGFVLANANSKRRKQVLGKKVSDEVWFKEALATKDGTEYFAQDITSSCIEDVDSLVYSTAVREDGDTHGVILGAMGVFFDFQDEALLILTDYMPRYANNSITHGWYSVLTNKDNTIIGSSDPFVFRINEQSNITSETTALSAGESFSTHLQVDGNMTLLASVRTQGYLEYPGLDWCCHAFIPQSDIFDYHETSDIPGIDKHKLLDSGLVPEINKEAFALTKNTEGDIQDISINGIIIANKIGPQAQSLTPIFDSITHIGEFATKMMEDLLLEMAYDQLNHNFESLCVLAKQAIDLIDRNLFERSADIRWWATDQTFHQTLGDPTQENCQKSSARLKVINNSYTMYRNLVLLDISGNVLASSNDALRGHVQMVNVAELEWFGKVAETTLSSEYVVADVSNSPLEPSEERSLIYTAGVRENGARRGQTIGAVAIMFDWQTEARQMLETCVPQGLDGSSIDGCFAVYTNSEFVIIEASQDKLDLLGTALALPEAHANLKLGETIASTFDFMGKTYVVGSARTQGYREYKGLAWMAHVFRPFNN